MDSSTIINILAVLAIAWFFYSRFAPTKGLKNLNAESFSDELKKNSNQVLIDVREPGEFQSGSIPGSINIPLSEL